MLLTTGIYIILLIWMVLLIKEKITKNTQKKFSRSIESMKEINKEIKNNFLKSWTIFLQRVSQIYKK